LKQSQEPSGSNPEPPVHPFAKAADMTYVPPTNHNFATVPKPPPAKKNKPVYKTLPLIYDGKITIEVYDCTMASEVTLTQCELFSLSPKVHEVTSAHHVLPNKDHSINVLTTNQY
jgi:hypothetical protein